MNSNDSGSGASVNTLLERIFMFLEDGEWESADIYCEKVLDIEPKNALAYLGKLMVKYQISQKENLPSAAKSFEDDSNYKKILRFGDEDLVAEIKEYNNLSIKKGIEAEKEAEYSMAVQHMREALSADDYFEAAELFKRIGDYKDSISRREKCTSSAEYAYKDDLYTNAVSLMKDDSAESYEQAISIFNKIHGWKDSDLLIKECQTEIRRICEEKEEFRRQAQRLKEDKDKKRKENQKKCVWLGVIAALFVVAAIAYKPIKQNFIIPQMQYRSAVSLLKSEKYEDAIIAFERMDGYRKSKEKITECYRLINEREYLAADALYHEGKFEEAIAAFEALNGYKDSTKKIGDCKEGIKERQYQAADALYRDGKYEEAIAAFDALNGYKESPEKIQECKNAILDRKYGEPYAEACALMNEQKYEEAINIFVTLNGYKNSNEKVLEAKQGILDLKYGLPYDEGCALLKEAKYEEAIAVFKQLNGYKDSAQLISDCEQAILDLKYGAPYVEAVTIIKEEKYEEAIEILSHLNGYKDSNELINQCEMSILERDYNTADNLFNNGSYEESEKMFTALKEYRDSRERVIQCRNAILERSYKNALELFEKGKYDEAIKSFGELDGYKDSVEKINESHYKKALLYEQNGEIISAVTEYYLASMYDHEYRDCSEKISRFASEELEKLMKSEQSETVMSNEYLLAEACFSACDYLHAAEAFEFLREYKNAQSRAVEAKYNMAEQLFADEYYTEAAEIYSSLDGIQDSAEKANKSRYLYAIGLLEEKMFDDAKQAFQPIVAYLDSADMIKECDYQKAMDLFIRGKYEQAEELFSQLGVYSDSSTMCSECSYKIAGILAEDEKFDEAIYRYETLASFKDSKEKIAETRYNKGRNCEKSGDNVQAITEYYLIIKDHPGYNDCKERIIELCPLELDSLMKEGQTDEIKKNIFMLAEACFSVADYNRSLEAFEFLGEFNSASSRAAASKYNLAEQYYNDGKYLEASEFFKSLNGLSDSTEKANKSYYYYAAGLLKEKQFDKAKKAFQSISTYSDASNMMKECDYQKACALFESGDYQSAKDIYHSLGSYSDSVNKGKECTYQIAEKLMAEKKYSEADSLYESLGQFKDCQEKVKICRYSSAEEKYAAEDYLNALPIYQKVANYKDSAEKIRVCRYILGNMYFENKEYEAAIIMLNDLKYNNSENLVSQSYCMLGNLLHDAGKDKEAIRQYILAGNLVEAKDMLYSIGISLYEQGKVTSAAEVFWLSGDYSPSVEKLKEIASTAEFGGKNAQAFAIYVLLGNTQKELQMSVGCKFSEIESLNLGEISDIPEMNTIIEYIYADCLIQNGQYKDAITILEKLNGYKESKKMITFCKEHLFAEKAMADSFTFGKYNGKPIEWTVLERNNESVFVISNSTLESMPYNDSLINIGMTWEKSNIRSWLNGTFEKQAFDEFEDGEILQTNVKNYDNASNGSNGGSDTNDKIFLLSISEFRNYKFNKSCGKTWWLRSPGKDNRYAATVSSSGSENTNGSKVKEYNAIRPAMKINTSIRTHYSTILDTGKQESAFNTAKNIQPSVKNWQQFVSEK